MKRRIPDSRHKTCSHLLGKYERPVWKEVVAELPLPSLPLPLPVFSFRSQPNFYRPSRFRPPTMGVDVRRRNERNNIFPRHRFFRTPLNTQTR